MITIRFRFPWLVPPWPRWDETGGVVRAWLLSRATVYKHTEWTIHVLYKNYKSWMRLAKQSSIVHCHAISFLVLRQIPHIPKSLWPSRDWFVRRSVQQDWCTRPASIFPPRQLGQARLVWHACHSLETLLWPHKRVWACHAFTRIPPLTSVLAQLVACRACMFLPRIRSRARTKFAHMHKCKQFLFFLFVVLFTCKLVVPLSARVSSRPLR